MPRHATDKVDIATLVKNHLAFRAEEALRDGDMDITSVVYQDEGDLSCTLTVRRNAAPVRMFRVKVSEVL